MRNLAINVLFVGVAGCGGSGPDELPSVYRLPIVVHVLHHGEPVGQGHNLSDERIASQLRVLNEDYRRKSGTPGDNSHPDGADTGIEFVRVVPGSRDMPRDVAAHSIQALAKVVSEVAAHR